MDIKISDNGIIRKDILLYMNNPPLMQAEFKPLRREKDRAVDLTVR